MKKFFKVVLVLVIAVFMYGCNKSLEIQGSKSININESHTYKVVSVSTEDLALDSYKWEVDSKNKDFTLTNDESSEVVFNAKSVGKYTLEVRAKDGRKTLKAKTVIEVSEPEIINGYPIPSEPDPVINNSTVLGVDSNDNIIRDDVERWIYNTYTEPVEIGLFMQSARAYQLIIKDPSKAQETVKYSDNALACEFYYAHQNDINILDKYKYFENSQELERTQFNNIERHIAYKRYNAEFNGKVLHAPKASKEKCEFDENGILGELK